MTQRSKQCIVVGASLAVAVVLSVLGWGCPGAPATEQQRPKVVAVATLMAHPALDQVVASMKQELRRRGLVEGRDIRYVMRNANGQANLAPTIAAELAAQEPDVTVAVTTPMAQAIAKTVRGRIVFSAVTDPVGAGVVRSLTTGEPRITGVSDAWPYEAQLRLVREVLPSARRLGVLFNPGESASQYGIRRIRELAPRLGFTLVEGAVATSNDVATVAATLAPQVDALYPSSDNTVISGIAGAVRVAMEQHKPLFVGDSGTVENGGLAAASVGYAGVGRDTGALVARVLRGEDRIPVVVASEAEVFVNTAAAQRMGVTLPPSVVSRARRVFTEVR